MRLVLGIQIGGILELRKLFCRCTLEGHHLRKNWAEHVSLEQSLWLQSGPATVWLPLSFLWIWNAFSTKHTQKPHVYNQSFALSDCRFPKHCCIFNWISLRYAPRPFGLSERCGGILPCGYAWIRTGRCFSKSLQYGQCPLALTRGAFKGSDFELKNNEACLKDLLV